MQLCIVFDLSFKLKVLLIRTKMVENPEWILTSLVRRGLIKETCKYINSQVKLWSFMRNPKLCDADQWKSSSCLAGGYMVFKSWIISIYLLKKHHIKIEEI